MLYIKEQDEYIELNRLSVRLRNPGESDVK